MVERIPDPALVVLVGASGSGKTTWARQHYRVTEIVGSDALRAVVGSGESDLDASAEAFELLERIVAMRLRRRLTVVVDTLGTETARRRGWLDAARAVGVPVAAVVLDTPAELCRARNRARDRPVPASVLTGQLRRMRTVADQLTAEGWQVVRVDGGSTTPDLAPPAEPSTAPARGDGPEIVLQISRFPWGEDPAGWLTEVALAADRAGLAGIALMDHLIQIPQVGRAWEPIPEPWVTLGLLAGLGTRLRLGTLVSPVTFRAPGVTAKAAATLDVLSGGRAFLGLGAGWWAREHAGFGLGFPDAAARSDALEAGIEAIRALWATGTKPYDGHRARLPETTCYPRPVGSLPIIVGGAGERRTLRTAARLADACNLPSDPELLPHRIDVLRRHCDRAGRDPDEVAVTVLDVPVIGSDREDVARRVERLRGRAPASTFAARHRAGTPDRLAARYGDLAALGVTTVFCALPDLADPADVERLAPVVAGLG